MDICHLKNAELEPKFQQCEGRVFLFGDIVKGRFRFLMVYLQSKVRLRAADAVSAHIHV